MDKRTGREKTSFNPALVAACLASYEIAASGPDFMVTVTEINPEDCLAYSLDANGCLIFHMIDGDWPGYPPPEPAAKVLRASSDVLVVRMLDGEPRGYKLVPQRVQN